jgi:hypothetical protein
MDIISLIWMKKWSFYFFANFYVKSIKVFNLISSQKYYYRNFRKWGIDSFPFTSFPFIICPLVFLITSLQPVMN